MSFNKVATIVYGISLSPQEARKIHDTLKDRCAPGCGIYLPAQEQEAQLFADGSHFAAQSLSYAEGLPHVFGISFGRMKEGDEYYEDIFLIRQVGQDIINCYEKEVVVFLHGIGIDRVADIHVVEQVY